MASSRMLTTRSAVQCREAALEPEPAVEHDQNTGSTVYCLVYKRVITIIQSYWQLFSFVTKGHGHLRSAEPKENEGRKNLHSANILCVFLGFRSAHLKRGENQ